MCDKIHQVSGRLPLLDTLGVGLIGQVQDGDLAEQGVGPDVPRHLAPVLDPLVHAVGKLCPNTEFLLFRDVCENIHASLEDATASITALSRHG